jgi:hypothetical protein
MKTKPDMLAAVGELAAQAEAREWDGGIRIVLQGSMRAPITNGQVSLEAGWRVDVFYDSRARRPAFVLVNETPEGALRDLAAIIEEQRAPLGITKSRNV